MSDDKAPDIKQVLPHREPFLFIDRVVDFKKGEWAVCEFDVSEDKEFFKGHFPSTPIMPGVLMLEAMAQAGGYAILAGGEPTGRLGFLAAIDRARFRKKVVPGGILKVETSISKVFGPFVKAIGKTFYEGELAAEAEITFTIGE